MNLILASKSPRRKKLLLALCNNFEIIPPDTDEEIPSGLTFAAAAEYLARIKAQNVFARLKRELRSETALVLGADTIVVLDGEILGKPETPGAAREMLHNLSGRRHSVITGLCLISAQKTLIGHCISGVTFNALSKTAVKEYVKSGLCFDKAGGYGIQDGYKLVKNFEGSYTNIVGLPVKKTGQMLKEAGFVF